MSSLASKATGLALALLLAGNASAFELGQASGRATLGQPLRLEIPLSGIDGQVPAPSCFRLRQPSSDVGSDFAARNGHIEVQNDRGRVKLIVTTSVAVRDPVIGFTVNAGCEFGLSREYTMLVGFPTAPAVETVRAEAPAAPAPRAEPAARAPGETTLNDMAREKYPSQPRARERYIRMMLKANPELSDRDVPIAAGTELREPRGLPERRTHHPKPPAARAEAAEMPASPAASTEPAPTPAPPPPKPQQRAAKKGGDRLVLGTAPETKESVLLAEAERLTNVLLEQSKTQEEMVANIATLEANYNKLHDEMITLQAQLAHAEAERLEAQKAADYSRFAKTLDLVVAVLGGGALGGIVLRLFERRRTETAALDAEVKTLG